VREVFSSVAGKYDLMNDLMSLGVHRVWKRYFVATSGVAKGDRVLDLAGGTGDMAMRFAKMAQRARRRNGGPPAKIVVVGANPGSVLMTVQPGSGTRFMAGTTGSFAGSFLLEDVDVTQAKAPVLKRKATFRGMVVDDGTGARGYGAFLLPEMPALTPVITTLTSSPIRSGRVRVNGLP
jgi:hypothetical protein